MGSPHRVRTRIVTDTPPINSNVVRNVPIPPDLRAELHTQRLEVRREIPQPLTELLVAALQAGHVPTILSGPHPRASQDTGYGPRSSKVTHTR